MLDVAAQHVQVSGRRVAFRRAGQGPALVLLHGGLSDGREWLPLMADLSDVADLVAVDIPGCGGSDDPPPGTTLADLADVVAGLVVALGLAQPHVGGLSFGGGLALQVATRHPDLPASLVLMSAYAGWAGSLPPEEVAARTAWARAVVNRPPWTDTAGGELVPGSVSTPLPADLAGLLAQVEADFRPVPTGVLLEAFAAADLRAELGTVRCPTLVVHGELDVRAPRPVADALAAGIPGARLVVVEGAGHQVNLEARAEVADIVREHLRGFGAGSVR